MNYYIIILALMIAGCGGRQPNPKQQIKETDSRINVHFIYSQLVAGYEVTGRWMPFDAHSETGEVIIYFRHVESGQSFQYTENIYRNFDMDEITFSEGFKGYQDGDIYYLNYGAYDNPDSYNDSPLNYYAPFQFYDVDFDGEQELLINDCGRTKGGNTYKAYKIKGDKIELMDYVPFNTLDNDVTFDKHNKKIRLHHFDGVFDSSSIVFSKNPTTIRDKHIPQGLSQGWTTGGQILADYYKQDKTDFRLDSIYQYFNQDSVHIYATVNGKLKLVRNQNYSNL